MNSDDSGLLNFIFQRSLVDALARFRRNFFFRDAMFTLSLRVVSLLDHFFESQLEGISENFLFPHTEACELGTPLWLMFDNNFIPQKNDLLASDNIFARHLQYQMVVHPKEYMCYSVVLIISHLL